MDIIGFKDERWFKAYFLNAPIPLSKIEKDGTFSLVNERFAELVGYSRSELLTKNFKDLTDPEDFKWEEEMFNELLLRKNDSYSMIKKFISKQGKMIWVDIFVKAIVNEETNEVECFASTIIPLPNHGHFKVEKKQEELIIRPTIKLSEIIKDNWKIISLFAIPFLTFTIKAIILFIQLLIQNNISIF